MRSIWGIERKPLKNPRSFCQAYELQIAVMLAQENPYMPNAHCYHLCDIIWRYQAIVSLADIGDFLGQGNNFPERHLYTRDSWKLICALCLFWHNSSFQEGSGKDTVLRLFSCWRHEKAPSSTQVPRLLLEQLPERRLWWSEGQPLLTSNSKREWL